MPLGPVSIMDPANNLILPHLPYDCEVKAESDSDQHPPLMVMYQVDFGMPFMVGDIQPKYDGANNFLYFVCKFQLTVQDLPAASTWYVLSVYGWDWGGASSFDQVSVRSPA